MKRLFIAAKLPDDLKDELLGFRLDTRYVDWTPWQNYHLTLFFLGEVEKEDALKIEEELLGPKFDRFDMSLNGVGHFGTKSDVRALWAGVEAEYSLIEMQKKIQGIVLKHLPNLRAKKFVPHITLGRPKVKFHPDQLEDFYQRFASKETDDFTIEEIQIVESHLSKEGPIYTVVSEIPLS